MVAKTKPSVQMDLFAAGRPRGAQRKKSGRNGKTDGKNGRAESARTAAGGDDTMKRSRGRKTAESMAKSQREISVSEFFTKNRHLLGFDNPRKALLTGVKEAVDNSLDACEEAGISPELYVEIRPIPKHDDRFTVIVEDNGPGIVKSQIPLIFGKLLYGSKFHRLKQSRGQQGIGISAAGMYGQLTTGSPVRITSRTSRRATPHYFEVRLNTTKNKPEYTDEERDWDKRHGTRVEIDMEAEYRRGMRSVDEYLKQTAVANPHVKIVYRDPSGVETVYEQGTKDMPVETKEIKPHPHGVELGFLIKMLHDSKERTLHAFLQSAFTRVSAKVSKEICERAKLSSKAHPKRIAREEADRLHKAVQRVKIMAPPTSCIAPIGEDVLLAGLAKEVKADFYTASTRPPAVYRGNPFLVEAALAYGREGDTMEITKEGKILARKRAAAGETELLGNADETIKLIRFANRVPLQYQQSACAITKGVISVNWKQYAMQQPRGALPIGPMVLAVHIASVWVPFTSESKEAIASYPEILKELKLAVQDCGRKLATHIRKGKRIATEHKKRSYIEMYLPHIGIGLQEILGISDKDRDKDVAILKDVLEKSRKI